MRVFKLTLPLLEGCKVFDQIRSTSPLKLFPGIAFREDNLLAAYFERQLRAFGEVEGFPNLLRDGNLSFGRNRNLFHGRILP